MGIVKVSLQETKIPGMCLPLQWAWHREFFNFVPETRKNLTQPERVRAIALRVAQEDLRARQW